METLQSFVDFGNTYVWGFPKALPWLVVLLLGVGFVVTIRVGFIQLRKLGHSIRVVAGKYDDPDDPGDVSHFQALSTALSATVGIGNIAGVATAIHFGGPGAVFWMWVTAVFGMALKFAECTLSTHYRGFDEKGEAAGGPMFYIENGLGKSWKPMAMFFAAAAIICSFGAGNMNQANTMSLSASTGFGLTEWISGILLAAVVGSVILGGIKSIAAVSSKLAPTMAVIYVLAALTILALNAGEIPGAIGKILSNAFEPKAGIGGSVAGVWSLTLLWGVKRGLFSNEAGQGSAPIAHAAAKTDEPVREGAVAMLGPLIDTLIICTMTALVIVITGVWDKKQPTTLGLKDAVVHVEQSDKRAEAVIVTVEQGKVQGGVVLVYRDGPIDEAKLVKDKMPWTGKFKYVPADEGKISEFNTEGVTIEGKALQNSSALTEQGFKEGLSPLGDWGNYVVTLCVFLFAISTIISWSYYGDRCVVYLFGAKYVIVYRVLYIAFTYIGATTALKAVWDFGDLALGLMTVPNLIAVVLLLPKVVELTRDYFARMSKVDDFPEASAKRERKPVSRADEEE